MISDVWFHQSGDIVIHIPEIKELSESMNRIADELEKANNKSGKHVEGEEYER